ncbi:SMI1/KNR4 family protein [Pseudoprimorskyibacter insulae]|uniref:Knr4/Smi1-like domain-containing protein n=1 Tax=Pseudoprimorskyibacter insulae TaxID=1695997 RepID=A0A2R8AWU6_9RHOB|nr:SMI1/KNR4 family protein [Pseudoprimorskyibacter insulae]SPF80511.1 hypothetical protein PRI8871_02321 [Pseudoprimorskyibacter insulae]
MTDAGLIAQLRSRQPRIDAYAAMGLRVPAPAPPATPAALDHAEASIGHPLPPLLRQIYVQIANGGFGPGYGLLGLTDGATDDRGNTADQLYTAFRTAPAPNGAWPDGLVPLCHFGGGIYHCLHLPTTRMAYWDPTLWDESAPMTTAIFDLGQVFRDWLTAWAEARSTWADPAPTRPFAL